MYVPQQGFFGRDTAKVDWCEHNYVYSKNIAEFWNTVSGSALFLYPITMIALSHRYTRFYTSKSIGTWLIHCLIGIGTMYYHATLSLAGQLIDEIAIMWVLSYTLAVWLPIPYYEKYMEKSVFQVCCAVGSAILTFLAALSPFLNAFCLVLLVAPFALIVYTEVKRFNLPETNRLFLRVLFFVVCGFSIWGMDRAACEYWKSVGFPYFHSVWHICIAIAGHEVCIIAMYFHSLDYWKDLHTEIAQWPEWAPKDLSYPYVKMFPKPGYDKNYNFRETTIQNGDRYNTRSRNNVAH